MRASTRAPRRRTRGTRTRWRRPGGAELRRGLDEDRLDADSLEEGADPPEHWSAAARYGTTPYERSRGEDPDRRLSAERPDVE
ncbi:hypothetical protein [Actinophytocola sp.]|uniref:hypothetical protein n=1 Tax=Actinophytocola sp. TaxID=1872138 RepID=UPI003D6A51CE